MRQFRPSDAWKLILFLADVLEETMKNGSSHSVASKFGGLFFFWTIASVWCGTALTPGNEHSRKWASAYFQSKLNDCFWCGEIEYCELETESGTIRRRIQFCVDWRHSQLLAHNMWSRVISPHQEKLILDWKYAEAHFPACPFPGVRAVPINEHSN